MELTKQALDKLGLRSKSLVDENNVRQPGTASWVGQDWRFPDDDNGYKGDEFRFRQHLTIKWLFLGFSNYEKPELLNFLKKKEALETVYHRKTSEQMEDINQKNMKKAIINSRYKQGGYKRRTKKKKFQ